MADPLFSSLQSAVAAGAVCFGPVGVRRLGQARTRVLALKPCLGCTIWGSGLGGVNLLCKFGYRVLALLCPVSAFYRLSLYAKHETLQGWVLVNYEAQFRDTIITTPWCLLLW